MNTEHRLRSSTASYRQCKHNFESNVFLQKLADCDVNTLQAGWVIGKKRIERWYIIWTCMWLKLLSVLGANEAAKDKNERTSCHS